MDAHFYESTFLNNTFHLDQPSSLSYFYLVYFILKERTKIRNILLLFLFLRGVQFQSRVEKSLKPTRSHLECPFTMFYLSRSFIQDWSIRPINQEQSSCIRLDGVALAKLSNRTSKNSLTSLLPRNFSKLTLTNYPNYHYQPT